MSRLILGSTKLPIKCVPGSFPGCRAAGAWIWLFIEYSYTCTYPTSLPCVDRDKFAFFFTVRQPLLTQGRLIVEASRSHSDTPHSVGLLCKGDQPDAGTSTCQNTTLTRDRHSWPWWDSNPQFQQAKDRKPRGHWVYLYLYLLQITVLVACTTCCNIKELCFLNIVCICVFHWFMDTDYFPDNNKIKIFVMDRPCVLWW